MGWDGYYILNSLSIVREETFNSLPTLPLKYDPPHNAKQLERVYADEKHPVTSAAYPSSVATNKVLK